MDEVLEAGAAVELGQENCGVGLGLGGFDPLKAGSDRAVFTAAFAKDSASITAHSHGIYV